MNSGGESVAGRVRKPWAFVKRDLTVLISYPFAFFLQFFGMFTAVLMFFFLARVFGRAASPYLEAYGGDYFPFVLVGIAFSGYMSVALSSFSQSIREGQMVGTLEAMLVTPTRVSTVLISSSLWNFTYTSLQVIGFLLIGYLFFHLDLGRANLPGALLVQVLTILAFSSLGILSAGFIVVFKQGNPLNLLLNSASALLGGVFYPVDVLPGWMQAFSNLLPITYSLHAMRMTVLQGAPLGSLLPDLLGLSVFALVLLPLSLWFFRAAVRLARREGTLTQY